MAGESSHVEFKSIVAIQGKESWCEIIKDIVAVSNSGGGKIYFGCSDSGCRVNIEDDAKVSVPDPADIVNHIGSYTNSTTPNIIVDVASDHDSWYWVVTVSESNSPIVFDREGSYSTGSGKPKIAFRVGVVYTRQAGRSCPANSGSIRDIFDRMMQYRLSLVKQVLSAPVGTSMAIKTGEEIAGDGVSDVRVVDDPNASHVFVDPTNITDFYPYDYKSLTSELRLRIAGFKQNGVYHDCRKHVESLAEPGLCTRWYYNPNNYSGGSKMLYSEAALDKLHELLASSFR